MNPPISPIRDASIPDPENFVCECGDDFKKVCKACAPAKKIAYVQWQNERNQKRSNSGPIRRYTLIPEPRDMPSKKQMAQRMDYMREMIYAKTGVKLSRRAFREYNEREARKLQESHRAVLEAKMKLDAQKDEDDAIQKG